MRTRGKQFSLSLLTLIPGLNCPMGFLDYTSLSYFFQQLVLWQLVPRQVGLFTGCLLTWQLHVSRLSNPRERVEKKHYQDGSHSLFRTSSQKWHPITHAIFYSFKENQEVQTTLNMKELYKGVDSRRKESLGSILKAA